MRARFISGAVLAAVLTTGAAAAPATASALTPDTRAASTATTPVVTVTSPESYLPNNEVLLKGKAPAGARVTISLPGIPLTATAKAGPKGNWKYLIDRPLKGNFQGTVRTADSAATTFNLYDRYPEPGHSDAAFRPVAVTHVERTSSTTATVSGSATPGAVIYVQTAHWREGVTVADAQGRWSVDMRKATANEGYYNWSWVYQHHAQGQDRIDLRPLGV